MIISRICFGFVLAASLLIGRVQAADLFVAAPESARKSIASDDLPKGALVGETQFNLDEAALSGLLLPDGAEKSADRAEKSGLLSGSITIPLTRTLKVDFNRSDVEAALDSGIVWRGSSADGGTATLVVDKGMIVGAVDVGGRHFLIEPVAGKLHRLREVRRSAYPKDIHVSPKGLKHHEATDVPAAKGTTVITLYAVYSRAARMKLKYPAAKITLDVAIVNGAMKNSGVPIRIDLVKAEPIALTYSEKGGAAQKPLDDITAGNTAALKQVRRNRDALHADLVTFYVDRPEYCGIAWVLPNPTSSAASHGFSAINVACTGTPTLAHELGHNMGLNHDRAVEPAAPVSAYNYGYVNMAGKFRDIMSYPSRCTAVPVKCDWIAYYSSPRVLYKGFVTGIAKGEPGAADSARALRENRAGVASFR